MRNRTSGPPQFRLFVFGCIALVCGAIVVSAQAPSNTLRDGLPTPSLRSPTTPRAPGSAPLPAAAATPSTVIMKPATLIPTAPTSGFVTPTQAAGESTVRLRVTGSSSGNSATNGGMPSYRTPANGGVTIASPNSAVAGGSQLEIRRPAPTASFVVPNTNTTAPTVNSSSPAMATPGAADVRIIPPTPPAAPAPPTVVPTPPPAAPVTVQPLTVAPVAPPLPIATPAMPAAPTNLAPPAVVTAPVVIGGDETDVTSAIPVPPPLAIGGKQPAPTTLGPTLNETPSALPGLPQIGSSAAPATTSIESNPIGSTEIEAVDFNGVTLGETTLDEVLQAWGQPLERATEGTLTRCRYLIEPFAGVDVAFREGKSLSIIIDLGKNFTADAVAEELGIASVTPVTVEDERGRVLGVVYPERGVSLRFAADEGGRQVAQIGLDQIDPRPFILRAERNLATKDSAALADVETALKLDAANARAHWIKARLLAASGRRREALASAEAALQRDPKGAEYLLTRAALLAEAGLFDAALHDGETILNGTPGAPHLQARAWLLRGNLLADGPTRNYEQAIDAHTRAVRLAEPLANDARPAIRRAAQELLVDAHLAIANDVAWGNWQQKEIVVPQWLSKAVKLAEAWIAAGDVSPDVRLTIARQALAAGVGMQGGLDPQAWADALQQRTNDAVAKCDDPLRRKRLQYAAGLGLYDALQSYHTRGDVTAALKCGEAAVELLSQGRTGRDEAATDPYMYGRLYFRIGSLYAVKRQDHAKAVEWFERAAPLLERPLPEAAAADRGRQGETLVSMGVSYWAVGKRDRALELTNVGSRYMQQAADAGSLATDALAVPYTNLSVMHRQLGDETSGKKFHEMATRVESTTGGLKR